jgi:hypothetical protein
MNFKDIYDFPVFYIERDILCDVLLNCRNTANGSVWASKCGSRVNVREWGYNSKETLKLKEIIFSFLYKSKIPVLEDVKILQFYN